MAKVKYRLKEFTPNANQTGMSHSWSAEAVISNEITNVELTERIAKRTGFKDYECGAIIAAIAEIVAEEVLESNRVHLTDNKGTKMVSIYPKVSGSVSDKDVQANQEKYPGKSVATEDMVTPDLLNWNLGATVGIKFSKQFALNKQAQKVKYVASDVVVTDDDEPTTPSGGDNTPDPNEGGSNEE